MRHIWWTLHQSTGVKQELAGLPLTEKMKWSGRECAVHRSSYFTEAFQQWYEHNKKCVMFAGSYVKKTLNYQLPQLTRF
jgi:hypothetical protein